MDAKQGNAASLADYGSAAVSLECSSRIIIESDKASRVRAILSGISGGREEFVDGREEIRLEKPSQVATSSYGTVRRSPGVALLLVHQHQEEGDVWKVRHAARPRVAGGRGLGKEMPLGVDIMDVHLSTMENIDGMLMVFSHLGFTETERYAMYGYKFYIHLPEFTVVAELLQEGVVDPDADYMLELSVSHGVSKYKQAGAAIVEILQHTYPEYTKQFKSEKER